MKKNKNEKEVKDLDDEDLEDESLEEEQQCNEVEEQETESQTEDIDDAELDNSLRMQEELTNRLQRLQADFANYKKRVEKEKEGLVGFGIETLATEIFPVMDNFERALDSAEDKDDPFYKGIEMIHSELVKVLNKNNIKEMDCLEEPFDPEFHHAVGMESTDKYEKDTIIRILQKGYNMKDKVIRPAMVIVSQ